MCSVTSSYSIVRGLSLLVCVTLLGGCAATVPDFVSIYDRSARYHDPRRNPVIVIPGILGSKLRDASGQVVWGAFSGDSADPETPEGARLFSLPIGEGSLETLTDSVTSDGALETLKVTLLGLPFELGAYVNLLKTLGVGGYQDQQLALAGAINYGDDHYTCFQFDYDWRRDNVENARRLLAFIKDKKAYVEAENKKRFGDERSVKFDIVAHSMGGLVTRYFLRYGGAEPNADGPNEPTWAGAEYVERAILVGTPSGGSANALIQLIEGVQLSPIVPSYGATLIGTLPSVYELLPRGRHGALLDTAGKVVPDLLDPELWISKGWGLAAKDHDGLLAQILPQTKSAAGRRELALGHLRKCLERARSFQEALDVPAKPPEGLDLYLVAGDAVPTNAILRMTSEGGVEVCEERPGDGTVIRDNALLDERQGMPTENWDPHLISPIHWRQVFFVFTDHLGMTRDPSFTDNVLYLLLVDPRRGHRPHLPASQPATSQPESENE